MKKARYDGPSGTGVDVIMTLPDGQIRNVHVDHGHQLPTELEDGTKIPAAERDKLLATTDWAEVNIDDAPKQESKSEPATVAEKGAKT